VIVTMPGRRKRRTVSHGDGPSRPRSAASDLSRQSMGGCPLPPLARVRPPMTGRYPKGLYDNV
jgi:hypothetical protein